MKFTSFVPLAALSSAFVLPSEQVLGELAIEDHHHHQQQHLYDDWVAVKDEAASDFEHVYDDVTENVKSIWQSIAHAAGSALDDAFSEAYSVVEDLDEEWQASELDAELVAAMIFDDDQGDDDDDDDDDPPHRGPPGRGPGRGRGPPHHGPPGRRPPHHGPPGRGRKPHHPPPHHHEPNLTVWELISKSKYTTKFAELVSEYDDLVEILNGTAANYTVFVPTNKAFEKIPHHGHKPSKEFIGAVLYYHVLPEFYPAARVLGSHTAPTLLKGGPLGPHPQRINIGLGFRGLTVNFFSRVIVTNIFGTNGVIHGIDSILIPPPEALKILELFPGEFSTLDLALAKTGLDKPAEKSGHGTFFAPNNFAWKKLGPKINAFLFSSRGTKYLKALLEYHVAPNNTLYSDAFYKTEEGSEDDELDGETFPHKKHVHVDLPVLLPGKSLAIDIFRWARFTDIKINGASPVAVADVVALDGVVHVLRNVLIPPRSLDAAAAESDEEGELTVEELVARLAPFVEDDGEWEEEEVAFDLW